MDEEKSAAAALMEEKKKLFETRKRAKVLELEEKKRKKKEDDEVNKDPEEDPDVIDKLFKDRVETINGTLEKEDIKILPDGEKQVLIDSAFETHDALKLHITNMSFCIAKSTLYFYHKTIDELGEALVKLKEEHVPKKKFAFKARKKKGKKKKKEVEKVEEKKDNEYVVSEKDLVIKDLKDTDLAVTASMMDGKDNILIENIDTCTISVEESIIAKAIYMKNIQKSKLSCGLVSGASFINELTDCELVVCSHQIRIHHSHRVEFRIFARSNPIIEHCDELSFGNHPRSDLSEKLEEIFGSATNKFAEVLDFNWHKKEHSPNWKLLEE